MIICKNCSTEFNGKFCPECGQKAKTARITLAQVGQDLRAQFVHFNQGFLYTISELTKRPGHSIREYLAGKRVRHVKPIKFMVWASAISFLIYQFLNFQERMLQQLELELGKNQQSDQIGQKVGAFLSSHPSLVLLCTVLLGGYSLLILVVTMLSKVIMLFYRAEIEAWMAQ